MIQTVPLIFIHQGRCDYLDFSLTQAHASNPSQPIYLISDAANDRFPFVSSVPMQEHFLSAKGLDAIYEHMSSNAREFELFCIQRWFILRDVMRIRAITNCFCMDSDVLLYADIAQERRKFAPCDMTLCNRSAGISFINTFTVLDAFCSFVWALYTDHASAPYQEMAGFWQRYRQRGLNGGVCDMYLFQLFKKHTSFVMEDMLQVIDGAIPDENINITGIGFVMENGMKKVVWEQGVPYGILASSGERVRFWLLHFQGGAKKCMKDYMTEQVDV